MADSYRRVDKPEDTLPANEIRVRRGVGIGRYLKRAWELLNGAEGSDEQALAHNGFDVVVPRDQVCCGALQAHAGDLEFACSLAGRNAELFSGLEIDAVVVNGVLLREGDKDMIDINGNLPGKLLRNGQAA